MLKYFAPYKVNIIIITLLCLILSVGNVVQGIILQIIVDTSVGNINQSFAVIVFIVVGYAIAEYLASMLYYRLIYSVSSKAISRIKDKIISSVLFSCEYSDADNKMDLLTLLNKDAEQVYDKLFLNGFGLIKILSSFFIAVIYLLTINVMLTCILLALGTVSIILPNIFVKKSMKYKDIYLDKNRCFNNVLKDALYGLNTLRLYGVEKKFQDKLLSSNKGLEESKVDSIYYDSKVTILSSCIGFFVLATNVVIAGYLSLQGYFTIGTVLAIMQVMNYVIAPMNSGPVLWAQMRSVKNISSNLLAAIKPVKVNYDFTNLRPQHNISVNNVSFTYDNSSEQVITNFDYVFSLGKKYAIVGKSGCGKSSLLGLLSSLIQPSKGTISIDGKPLLERNTYTWRSNIAVVQQNIYLFDETLRYNLCLGLEVDTKDLLSLISKVGLDDLVDSLPNGLDSNIGDNGNLLSGGEKQRISLIRAIIKNSPIILLDEVTSALDGVTAFIIEDMLLSLDKTIIAVTHQYMKSILERYDKILVMNDGQLIEEGTYDELIKQSLYFNSLIKSELPEDN